MVKAMIGNEVMKMYYKVISGEVLSTENVNSICSNFEGCATKYTTTDFWLNDGEFRVIFGDFLVIEDEVLVDVIPKDEFNGQYMEYNR